MVILGNFRETSLPWELLLWDSHFLIPEIFASVVFIFQTPVYEVISFPWLRLCPFLWVLLVYFWLFIHYLFYISLKVLRVRFHNTLSFHHFILWFLPVLLFRKFFLSKIWQMFTYSALKIFFHLILKFIWNPFLCGVKWDHKLIFFSFKILSHFYTIHLWSIPFFFSRLTCDLHFVKCYVIIQTRVYFRPLCFVALIYWFLHQNYTILIIKGLKYSLVSNLDTFPLILLFKKKQLSSLTVISMYNA